MENYKIVIDVLRQIQFTFSNILMIPEIQNMYRDNKSIYLGEINEWSLQTQETAYINNHVCFFASTGDVASYDNRELKLMDINVEQGVMSEVFSEKGGFPYCTIEKRNDSVLMAKVNKNGTDVPDKNTAVRSKTLKLLAAHAITKTGRTARKTAVVSNI